MVAMAPGIFVGPPISGAILSLQSSMAHKADLPGGDEGDRRYLGLQFFCGGTLMLGALFAIAGRFACEKKLWVKI